MFQRPKCLKSPIASQRHTSRFAQTRNPAQGEVARVFGDAYGGASHYMLPTLITAYSKSCRRTPRPEDFDNHARMWFAGAAQPAAYAAV